MKKSNLFGIIFIIQAVLIVACLCFLVIKMGTVYGRDAIFGTVAAAIEGACIMWVAGNACEAFEECDDAAPDDNNDNTQDL